MQSYKRRALCAMAAVVIIPAIAPHNNASASPYHHIPNGPPSCGWFNKETANHHKLFDLCKTNKKEGNVWEATTYLHKYGLTCYFLPGNRRYLMYCNTPNGGAYWGPLT